MTYWELFNYLKSNRLLDSSNIIYMDTEVIAYCKPVSPSIFNVIVAREDITKDWSITLRKHLYSYFRNQNNRIYFTVLSNNSEPLIEVLLHFGFKEYTFNEFILST